MKYYMTKTYYAGHEDSVVYRFHSGPGRFHDLVEALLGNPYNRVEVKLLAHSVARYRMLLHDWHVSAWPDRLSNAGLWSYLEEKYAHI